MKYYGGCDSGSTYTKCVIIDETGKMVADVTLRSRINAVLSCEESIEKAVADSDAVITVTRATKPMIMKEWVKPGTHFSCLGSDMEGKEEIDGEIFQGAKIYADDIAQCIRVGEMEIPLKEGTIKKEDITGEIGDLLCGNIVGRENDSEITIFDATGLYILDLVAAKVAITKAKEAKIGIEAEM